MAAAATTTTKAAAAGGRGRGGTMGPYGKKKKHFTRQANIYCFFNVIKQKTLKLNWI